MKTIEEIRQLFVEARNEAKKGANADVEVLVKNLTEMSTDCKSSYDQASACMERVKWRGLYERFDAVLSVIARSGVEDVEVKRFFGLPIVEESPVIASQDGIVVEEIDAPAVEVKSVSKKELLPPPPPAFSEEPVSNDGIEDAIDVVVDSILEEPVDDSTDSTVEPTVDIPIAETITEEPCQDAPTKEENEEPVENTVSFDPTSLRSFVGQKQVVERLLEEISAAKKRGKKSLDPIMLLGNRGLGKSTLMKLIAAELGVKFEFIDCSSLGNDVRSQRAVQKFFMNIAEKNVPVVIGFDEIHALPKHIQTMLLTLLNDGVFSYLAENGETKSLAIRDCTFIGATTDYDAILSTLRDRCNNLTFFLKDYTREELRRIFTDKFAAKGLTADVDVIESCINRCRSSIREVAAIVKGLETKAINADATQITMDMADVYFQARGCDPIGLREKDLEILRAIAAEGSGIISEETLAARVHLDVKILTKEYEPYLLKIGFISITNRGRCLSVKAKEYLDYGYYRFADGTTVGTMPDDMPAEETKKED